MCKCNPNIRTPYCGNVGCEWPKDSSLGHRNKDKIYVLTTQKINEDCVPVSYTTESNIAIMWKGNSTPELICDYVIIGKATLKLDLGNT